MLKSFDRPTLNDFTASLVVFLVALPLCLGIAIASGVPPVLGLITGIIGGLVVGLVAGSPLQVSGPAAGLAVMVWQAVETHGLKALGVIVFLAGLIQLVAGLLKVGQWFRAVSPAVIRGMLAGIGALILGSQFYVMMDLKPLGKGLQNLIGIPNSMFTTITETSAQSKIALLMGVVVIASMLAWDKFKPKSLKSLPGPLIGVLVSILVVMGFGLNLNMVTIPQNLFSTVTTLSIFSFSEVFSSSVLLTALAIAVVASAETLLCASATDQMHKGVRTKYNQELTAQGIGNLICGFFGSLPMTGVIVRSTANIQAGAKTRWSAVLHGVWLLLFVAVLPSLLGYISTAALAAILVLTGYKLLNFKEMKRLWDADKGEAMVFFITLVGIVATDLLTGVIVGYVVSVLVTRNVFSKLNIEVVSGENQHTVELSGSASFLQLPKLAAAIESLPLKDQVMIDGSRLQNLDLACSGLIESRLQLASETRFVQPDFLLAGPRAKKIVRAQ